MARLDGSYTKTLAKISKFKLLLLDDFGVTPLKGDEINDLFEIIEERTLNGSIIITACKFHKHSSTSFTFSLPLISQIAFQSFHFLPSTF